MTAEATIGTEHSNDDGRQTTTKRVTIDGETHEFEATDDRVGDTRTPTADESRLLRRVPLKHD